MFNKEVCTVNLKCIFKLKPRKHTALSPDNLRAGWKSFYDDEPKKRHQGVLNPNYFPWQVSWNTFWVMFKINVNYLRCKDTNDHEPWKLCFKRIIHRGVKSFGGGFFCNVRVAWYRVTRIPYTIAYNLFVQVSYQTAYHLCGLCLSSFEVDQNSRGSVFSNRYYKYESWATIWLIIAPLTRYLLVTVSDKCLQNFKRCFLLKLLCLFSSLCLGMSNVTHKCLFTNNWNYTMSDLVYVQN